MHKTLCTLNFGLSFPTYNFTENLDNVLLYITHVYVISLFRYLIHVSDFYYFAEFLERACCNIVTQSRQVILHPLTHFILHCTRNTRPFAVETAALYQKTISKGHLSIIYAWLCPGVAVLQISMLTFTPLFKTQRCSEPALNRIGLQSRCCNIFRHYKILVI